MLSDLLKILTDDYEVSIRPFDARWEVTVTCYSSNSIYRHVDRSPEMALTGALKMSFCFDRAGEPKTPKRRAEGRCACREGAKE